MLTTRYIEFSEECANQQDAVCVDASDVLQQPCEKSKQSKFDLDVSEGVWAAFILVVFTLLTSYIQGLVFGMYVSAILPCHLFFFVLHAWQID